MSVLDVMWDRVAACAGKGPWGWDVTAGHWEQD